MAITNFQYSDADNVVSWNYDKNDIYIYKKKIEDVVYYEAESLILILFEEDSPYSTLVGMNEDGSIKFSFSSSENIGISNLTSHPEIKIAAIGWEKENNNWLDYYFSIDPINGEIYKQYRSY